MIVTGCLTVHLIFTWLPVSLTCLWILNLMLIHLYFFLVALKCSIQLFHFQSGFIHLTSCVADNVFSSLVGLQFMWQLMPENDGLPHYLVHVPLKDSPLSDCGGLCGDLDIQIKLENSVRLYFYSGCE